MLSLESVEQDASARLCDNLRAIGLGTQSTRRLAREVLAGLYAGRVVLFAGSAASVLARECAQTLASQRLIELHIPVGLLHGGDLHRVFRGLEGRLEPDDVTAVVLEGINRSAPEVYGDALRSLFSRRLMGDSDALVLFGTLVDGSGALPWTPQMCDLGPVFDTDPSADWKDLLEECQTRPNALWRQAVQRACDGLLLGGPTKISRHRCLSAGCSRARFRAVLD